MWMTLGLLVTTGASILTLNTGLIDVIMGNPLILLGSFIGELAMVIALSAAIRRLSTGMATAMFFAYAALNGFTLSLIFLAYNLGAITMAFGTTVILFLVMTMIAYTTNIDLSKYSSYFMMGLIGLVIAMVANMFIGSGPLDYIISIAGVLIFTALIAFDTQRLYKMAADPEIQGDGAALLTKYRSWARCGCTWISSTCSCLSCDCSEADGVSPGFRVSVERVWTTTPVFFCPFWGVVNQRNCPARQSNVTSRHGDGVLQVNETQN